MSEDIFDQIANRELEGEFGPRTPLRRFKGKLEQIEARKETYGTDEDAKSSIIGYLHFTELDVIEASEPYDFPICEIRIGKIGNKEKSFWGIFEASYRKLIAPKTSLKELVGAMLEMSLTPDHLLYDGRQKTDTKQSAWETVSVGDVPTKQTAADRALQILDRKTLQQFNQAALADPMVRSDTAVQSAIMKQTFVKGLIDAGTVTMNADGVHTVGP